MHGHVAVLLPGQGLFHPLCMWSRCTLTHAALCRLGRTWLMHPAISIPHAPTWPCLAHAITCMQLQVYVKPRRRGPAIHVKGATPCPVGSSASAKPRAIPCRGKVGA